VAVLGCGPVGLMAVVGARELGATQVVAIDSVPERLALAERFGATAVDLGGARALVLELSAGRGADSVLEAVGNESAGRLAYELVRPGGTISAAGVHTEAHFPFSPGQAYDKNLTYRAGRCPARAYMERMLALVQSGRHPLASIISHRLPLGEGARAYELFDKKLEGCTKVLFRA
jgi:threonine dehydrogenase-like Zn-dependent dehydrogenase